MKTLLAFSMLALSPLPALAITFEKEVPREVSEQVIADLDVMRGIQGSNQTALHQKIFGNMAGTAYSAWFQNRVDTFGYTAYPSKTIPAVAFNDSELGKENHMAVTDLFVKGDQPQIARLTVLFHEARHSELDHKGWGHVKCPTPFKSSDGKVMTSIYSGKPLAGLPGCDTTAIGAYGISVVLMKNISLFCTNCSEKFKADAEIYAEDQSLRLLNEKDRKSVTDANPI